MLRELLESLLRFVTHRLFLLSIVIILMFSLLIHRLFYLQIIEGEKYLSQFTFSISKEREIGTTRGNIYDRYGRPLAINELAYAVTIDDSYDVEDKNQMIYDLITIIEKNGDQINKSVPIVINEMGDLEWSGSNSAITRFKKDIFYVDYTDSLSEEQEALDARALYEYIVQEDFFGIDTSVYTEEEALKIMAIRYALFMKRYSKYKPEVIAVNISDETLANIKENSRKLPGVSIIQDPLRIYPDGEYFAHIIGYTGLIQPSQLEELQVQNEAYDATDIVGQLGVEKEMEVYLRGKEGTEKVFVNNVGKVLEVTEHIDPVPGKDIYLTIDKELQIDTFNALEKQIATILTERIVTTLPRDSDNYYLVEDVIKAMVNNNLIRLSAIDLNEDSQLMEKFYNYYSDRKASTLATIENQLINGNLPSTLPENTKDILSYVYSYLSSRGILVIPSEVRSEDEAYQSYRSGTMSLKEFLRHAINSNYLDLTKLGLEEDYYGYEEIYEVLVTKVLDELDKDTGFRKEIYFDLIDTKSLPTRDWMLLLYEQEILAYDETMIQALNNGTVSPIDFIEGKIMNLEITPQQLALEPYSGSAVVTDVNTGEVLALVSYPTYDNNRLVNNMDNAYFVELLNDLTTPMFHRALQQRTAPGSTFKMVSAIAGLTEGVIQPGEFLQTEGIFRKISPAVACWIYSSTGGGNHGSVDVIQALATSCNFFFSEVAYRLSLSENGKYVSATGNYILGEYAAMFGLDEKTGIEIPEYAPMVSKEDAVRSAIGQAGHNYTPSQLARYVSTLANGGVVRSLNLIDKVVESDGTLFLDIDSEVQKISYFDEEYLNLVREGMYNVTNGPRGTARSIFADFPITVTGKSGTAEEGEASLNHSLFVGYAPYESPEVAIAVTIPNGITGSNSARVMKGALASYFALEDTNELLNYENILQ